MEIMWSNYLAISNLKFVENLNNFWSSGLPQVAFIKSVVLKKKTFSCFTHVILFQKFWEKETEYQIPNELRWSGDPGDFVILLEPKISLHFNQKFEAYRMTYERVFPKSGTRHLRHSGTRHCGTAALWHCGTVAPEPRVPDFGNIIYDIPKVRHLEISSAGLWDHRVGYSQSPALELSRWISYMRPAFRNISALFL